MLKRNKILIYNDILSGHNLEYIHHLHEGACENKGIDFIFAVPNKFKDVKDKLIWKESANVKFHFLSDHDIKLTGNLVMQSYKKSRIVRKIALKYSVDEVFFIVLMGFLPVISFFLPHKIKISGIIYLIYLYRWKSSPLILKIFDCLKYLILSKGRNFKNIFILNDKSAPVYLNKKFKTTKFVYLPDPYLAIDKNKVFNIRKMKNIPNENIVYLHFGALASQKGTLEILNAIEILNSSDLRDKCFIFAGKINKDIKDEFYKKYNKLKDKVQLIVFDEFCEYSFFGSLCLSSDYILLPYKRTSQSSGIIGYGAQFNIPVIVPNSGLLGKMVRKNNLGYLIETGTDEKIADFIKNKSAKNYYKNNETCYINEHNTSQFIQSVFSKLIK